MSQLMWYSCQTALPATSTLTTDFQYYCTCVLSCCCYWINCSIELNNVCLFVCFIAKTKTFVKNVNTLCPPPPPLARGGTSSFTVVSCKPNMCPSVYQILFTQFFGSFLADDFQILKYGEIQSQNSKFKFKLHLGGYIQKCRMFIYIIKIYQIPYI